MVFEVFISVSEEVIAYFSMTHRRPLLFASLWHLGQSGLCSDIESKRKVGLVFGVCIV